MIQLLFDADSVEEALAQEPVQVAFAQHSGGETADWDAPKLEREGTRPVVYASSGRTPRTSDRVSGSAGGRMAPASAAMSPMATRFVSIRKCVSFPRRSAARTILRLGDVQRSLGERETWVYDGPTGPAFKRQWAAPLSWMENSRRLDPGQRRGSHRSCAQRYLLRRHRERLHIVHPLHPVPAPRHRHCCRRSRHRDLGAAPELAGGARNLGVYWPTSGCSPRSAASCFRDPGRERPPVPSGNEPISWRALGLSEDSPVLQSMVRSHS